MKIKLTETQLNKVITQTIKEQGLYGNTSDVVDYDLPEFLSDTIILQSIENWSDVENSLKEIHKRLIRLEKGLDSGVLIIKLILPILITHLKTKKT